MPKESSRSSSRRSSASEKRRARSTSKRHKRSRSRGSLAKQKRAEESRKHKRSGSRKVSKSRRASRSNSSSSKRQKSSRHRRRSPSRKKKSSSSRRSSSSSHGKQSKKQAASRKRSKSKGNKHSNSRKRSTSHKRKRSGSRKRSASRKGSQDAREKDAKSKKRKQSPSRKRSRSAGSRKRSKSKKRKKDTEKKRRKGKKSSSSSTQSTTRQSSRSEKASASPEREKSQRKSPSPKQKQKKQVDKPTEADVPKADSTGTAEAAGLPEDTQGAEEPQELQPTKFGVGFTLTASRGKAASFGEEQAVPPPPAQHSEAHKMKVSVPAANQPMSPAAVNALFQRQNAEASPTASVMEPKEGGKEAKDQDHEERQFSHQQIMELIAKAGAGPPPEAKDSSKVALGKAEELMMKALMGTTSTDQPKDAQVKDLPKKASNDSASASMGPAEQLMMKALLGTSGSSRATPVQEPPQLSKESNMMNPGVSASAGPAEQLMMKALLGSGVGSPAAAAKASPEISTVHSAAVPSATNGNGPAEQLIMKALAGSQSPPLQSPATVPAVSTVAAAAAPTDSRPAEQLMMKALLGTPVDVQAPVSHFSTQIPAMTVPSMSLTSSSNFFGEATGHTRPAVHVPLSMPLTLGQTTTASQAVSSIGASDWPAPSAQAVQSMLGRFPQLDEATRSILLSLIPQHALAVLWDLNAKGGCTAVPNVAAFVRSAAQTLLQGTPGTAAGSLQFRDLLQASLPSGGLLAS